MIPKGTAFHAESEFNNPRARNWVKTPIWVKNWFWGVACWGLAWDYEIRIQRENSVFAIMTPELDGKMQLSTTLSIWVGLVSER